MLSSSGLLALMNLQIVVLRGLLAEPLVLGVILAAGPRIGLRDSQRVFGMQWDLRICRRYLHPAEVERASRSLTEKVRPWRRIPMPRSQYARVQNLRVNVGT